MSSHGMIIDDTTYESLDDHCRNSKPLLQMSSVSWSCKSQASLKLSTQKSDLYTATVLGYHVSSASAS